MVLNFYGDQPDKLFIKWSDFDKLLVLDIIDVELNNIITCTNDHKIDSFLFNQKHYYVFDEDLIYAILNSDCKTGIFCGTKESID